MTVTLKSFDELARVFGSSVKAELKVKEASYQQVESKCGRKAAVVWAWLQDREATKESGPKGSLFHNPQEIAKATDYELSAIHTSLISLLRNNYGRVTHDGLVSAC